jgi:hypothetical protein
MKNKTLGVWHDAAGRPDGRHHGGPAAGRAMWTLDLMGITILPLEPLFQRWIGAFVCSVGCSYLFPVPAPRRPGPRPAQHRHPDHGHHRAHLHRRLLRGGHRHRRARTGLALGDVHRRHPGHPANFIVLRKKILDPDACRLSAPTSTPLVAIVATYVYFLLFAQYGFIRLIGERGGSALAVDRAMAGMGSPAWPPASSPPSCSPASRPAACCNWRLPRLRLGRRARVVPASRGHARRRHPGRRQHRRADRHPGRPPAPPGSPAPASAPGPARPPASPISSATSRPCSMDARSSRSCSPPPSAPPVSWPSPPSRARRRDANRPGLPGPRPRRFSFLGFCQPRAGAAGAGLDRLHRLRHHPAHRGSKAAPGAARRSSG